MAWWQILLLTLYAGYEILDELQIYSSLNTPVGAGLIAGLVMGDLKTGLIIGGAMQLTVLGVGTFGGASKIDATTGTVLATAFSVSIKGMSPQVAISSIAVPVAAIMVQLDVLARFANTYFAHRIDHLIEENNYKGIERNFLYGAIPWALSRALPVFFALAFGGTFVETVVTGLANVQWLANGLKLAGQMLPGLGFAILLRYLPVRRNLHYLALGFGLTAMLTVLYSNVQSLGAAVSSIVGSDVFAKLPKEQAITFVNNFKSVSMIGIAIIGIFLAVQHFKNSQRTVVAAPASNVESGEIEDDEF